MLFLIYLNTVYYFITGESNRIMKVPDTVILGMSEIINPKKKIHK